ncbi:phage portal protein [Clostridium sporogenes]|uniref:phage portal protein n=1 Tax=Clostridium sporogenes TaxID=1509 RepID=UPI002237DAF0|nr:phage portal protein [Clostridium sporogenes]MCW6106839.1 phage portal protein [Clostridium sporogenes]
MGLFHKAKKKTSEEQREINFETVFGVAQPNTKTGLGITSENSLELTAIWSAVDQISNSVAKLPINVYRRSSKGKTEEFNHNIHKLLNKPNPFITKFDFFKTMVVNLLLFGNAYAWIDRGIGNKIDALWILNPNSVSLNLSPNGSKLDYQISINGKTFKISHKDIIHLKRISLDGYEGKSPVYIGRESIGIARASNEFLGSFYGNGTTVGDILYTDTQLTSDAKKNIRTAWMDANSGLSNAKKVAVLDLGLKHSTIDKNIVDMDFLNTQKFYSVEEVARLFNMPSTMLGDLSKATFSNVENLNLLYYKNTISPILCGIENEMDDKLFLDEEPLFTKFDMSEELRGDTDARIKYYKELQSIGALSPNEIRIKEGLQPIDDEGMYQHYMSLNYAPTNYIKQYQINKKGGGEGGTEE